MTRNRPRNLILLAPLVALAAASLTGCVSVGVARIKVADPQGVEGVIEVSIYDSPKEKKSEVLSNRGDTIDLLLLEKGREKPLESFSGPKCRKRGLSPGTYRIRIRPSGPQVESAQPPAKIIAQKDLRLGAGEVAHADVILKKFPTTTVLIVAGAAAAGIGVAAAVSVSNLGAFGSGTKANKCVRHADPGREARAPKLPSLLDLLRPLPAR